MSTVTLYFQLFIPGDNMSELLKIVAMEKHHCDMVETRLPADIVADQSIGHIKMSNHKDSYYVVLPTGHVMNATNEIDMWLLFVKATYVFNTMYCNSHTTAIAIFFEKLLNVPKQLCSKPSKALKRIVNLI